MNAAIQPGRSALLILILVCIPLVATALNVRKPVKLEPLGKVILYIEDEGKFEVLHSRAKSTATGAVLFGLIGAGIEESSRSGKDKEKEEAILVHIPDDACHNTLVDGMTERLGEKDYVLSVVTGKPPSNAGAEFVVRLKIDACVIVWRTRRPKNSMLT